MFGKRCTLCGGKLDGRNVCTECGLDNSKSDKAYKLNKSECDHKPLTHVHEEKKEDIPYKPEKSQSSKNTQGLGEKARRLEAQPYQSQSGSTQSGSTQSNPTQSYQSHPYKMQTRPPKGKRTIARIISILAVAGVIGGIILSVADHYEDSSVSVQEVDNDQLEDYNPYEWVTRTIGEEGESVEYNLDSGNYIVGTHIPEGEYKALPEDEFDTVRVDDSENGIFLYEYEQKERNFLDDLRFYNGAVVSIYSSTTLKLTSDNAQQLEEKGIPNPNTAQVSVKSGSLLVSGTDFAPGIYDIEIVNGYGEIEYTIYDESGNQISTESKMLGEGSTDGMGYRYAVLPENTTIKCKGDVEIVLKPSEVIASTDYAGFYTNY